MELTKVRDSIGSDVVPDVVAWTPVRDGFVGISRSWQFVHVDTLGALSIVPFDGPSTEERDQFHFGGICSDGTAVALEVTVRGATNSEMWVTDDAHLVQRIRVPFSTDGCGWAGEWVGFARSADRFSMRSTTTNAVFWEQVASSTRENTGVNPYQQVAQASGSAGGAVFAYGPSEVLFVRYANQSLRIPLKLDSSEISQRMIDDWIRQREDYQEAQIEMWSARHRARLPGAETDVSASLRREVHDVVSAVRRTVRAGSWRKTAYVLPVNDSTLWLRRPLHRIDFVHLRRGVMGRAIVDADHDLVAATGRWILAIEDHTQGIVHSGAPIRRHAVLLALPRVPR
ncbi:MAG: hypothetical protein IT353_14835 [Gemmatimonadaceae bacterium]|nr:hypothetical protein [Gemmatimonadaceae bacterium]